MIEEYTLNDLRLMCAKSKYKRLTSETIIGLVDADLLDNGTRHPNLALLKLAGYLRDNKIPYHLICDGNEDIEKYTYIYISRVFTFTTLPNFYLQNKDSHPDKFQCGGTGWYATIEDPIEFRERRNADFSGLEKDPRLPGINMCKQMPDYHLYDEFIRMKVAEGRKEVYFKDYLNYSIGFLTRGCFRHCSFCVNRLEKRCEEYSQLSDFVDESRRNIYLWDDNFFAAPQPIWMKHLEELIALDKPFQFRQGLDERLLTEDAVRLLSKARYHGDMIFAFDHWEDREIIEEKLKLWRSYCPTKGTKFYLFCGFELTPDDDQKLLQDVCEIFYRIRILMKYGCLGYVMRHEDYHKHRLGNIYTQIARWCNQPQFYKKMSFEQFIYQNQLYVTTQNKCKSVRTYEEFLERFDSHREELLDLFRNIKWTDLIDDKYKTKK